jgi:hypothetical protein
VPNRRGNAQDLVPVLGDDAGVDAVGEQLIERAVVLLRPANGEQPLVKHVTDARREAEAQRRAESEHVRRIAMGIGEVLMDVQIRFVIAQPIDDVQRFTVVRADNLGVIGQPKVGCVAVDRHPTPRTKVGRIAIGIGGVDPLVVIVSLSVSACAYTQTSDACQDVLDCGTGQDVAMGAVARVPGFSLGVDGAMQDGAIRLWPSAEPTTGSVLTATPPINQPITLRPGERANVLGRTICLVSVYVNGGVTGPGGAGSITLAVK